MNIWDLSEAQITALKAIKKKGHYGRHESSIHLRTRNALFRLKFIRRALKCNSYLLLTEKGSKFLKEKVGV